ncbi:hypothetical protein METEAL_23150 [Mesoterricola silvestris]|uniref:Uncharacterized protein n=1 Tax=Mesoterricola silvestris TaxID=2927979 RepID=A0AA48GWH8_9BACT|nr:hypothetical protein METEAL_23150 [Mesoterricola silvestris]
MRRFTSLDDFPIFILNRRAEGVADLVTGTTRYVIEETVLLAETILENLGKLLASSPEMQDGDVAAGRKGTPNPVFPKRRAEGQGMDMVVAFLKSIPTVNDRDHEHTTRGEANPLRIWQVSSTMADPDGGALNLRMKRRKKGQVDGPGINPPSFKRL